MKRPLHAVIIKGVAIGVIAALCLDLNTAQLWTFVIAMNICVQG